MLSLTWESTAVVAEKRALTKKQSDEVWAYMLKCTTIGATIEIRVNAETFNKVGQGEMISAKGVFDFWNGSPNFVADHVEIVKATKAA